MRGALIVMETAKTSMRIIPADAVSTAYATSSSMAGKDHPRGCGEHDETVAIGFELLGSSPRMRGARDLVHMLAVRVGIIPADAGSTRRSDFQAERSWDHPRGCGEHALFGMVVPKCGGSSPRMRGARSVIRLKTIRLRIIPADAGSTVRS